MVLEVRRKRIHTRIRKKVFGTSDRPRINIYRSLKNLYLQVIDDTSGTTLLSVSTLGKEFKPKLGYGGNVKAAQVLAESLAAKMAEKGIQQAVFDRGGYRFHGRVKVVAETLKKAGVKI
jgi:large subunit ribosomal protein L18